MVKNTAKNDTTTPFSTKYGVTGNNRVLLADPRRFADFPDLLMLQRKGFSEFIDLYINKLFEELNPMEDIAGDRLQLTIEDIKVGEAIEDIENCKRKEMTYGGIITGKIKLVDSGTKKVVFSKRANIGIMPLMTQNASYIINGVERIIISQIVRSYGIFYARKDFRYSYKIIPQRGPWLEVMVEKSGTIVARINKSRKFTITSLLRVFGLEMDESIKQVFVDTIEEEDTNYIEMTLKKDPTTDALSAAEHIYGKIRPGEIIDPENALDYIKSQFLDTARIFMGRIARRKINAKLDLDKALDGEGADAFDASDLIASIKYLLNLSNNKKGYYIDDSDNLANKRIRTVGEILYSHLQPVMRKFAKSVKGKLSVLNLEEQPKLTDLVNFKIIDNAIKSFFATSQLSQFLDQINPLAELEHKRRITALGPGGLKRETAKFDVRDVHPSHYGRICPIQTPEGSNIGLVLYQGLYARVNDEGFLETPAAVVKRYVKPVADQLVNRIAHKDMFELDAKGEPTSKLITKEGDYFTEAAAQTIEKQYPKFHKDIKVQAFFTTDEIDYISPERDEKCYIADATSALDDHHNFLHQRVAGRHFVSMEMLHVNDVTHIDINPSQIFSPNTSLIPFVNHNDNVRAAIATNQQRQGLPLVKNEAPLIGTGLEADIVAMTTSIIKADAPGDVVYMDASRVKVQYKDGVKEYKLKVFQKSNQKTATTQKPVVSLGQKVKKGDILAEGPSVQGGEMANGINLKVAYMFWDGYNFEDSIIISQRLVKEDALTSIHIEDYEIEVADTKLGPEQNTNDIPGVSMNKLRNLDDDGIIRIGAEVNGGDILVGKITPKGEGELAPEEKLIQAIFGDKSKSFKDTSLYLPAGSGGKIVDIIVLDSKAGDNLMAGVRKKIKVFVAMTRKIEVGDKLAAKHGNKGIVSIVVPEEDMPYTEDGKPVDIILNPLGVISRMNMGQVFETQLGLLAKTLGVTFAVPTFSQFGVEEMKKMLRENGLPEDGRMALYDGRTGEKFPNRITVGYMHMLKLSHMVEDKIHARSVGPYSLITQQPLGGKARDGGQRFGEMEVRALEAYSAVYTLQEMLTVKSDDVMGRNKMYEAIIKGQKPKIGTLPESFNFLVYLFKGLGQNIERLSGEQIDEIHAERVKKILALGLSGITSKEAIKQLQKENKAADIETDEDKNEIIDTVIKEMEDFGEIEETE